MLTLMNYPAAEQRGIPRTLNAPRGGELNPERLNTLGKTVETFRPVDEKVINIFTCGPSVYQRSHIGNFRTFLFKDIVVRYLEYSGYTVKRGMNFTDIEDKA